MNQTEEHCKQIWNCHSETPYKLIPANKNAKNEKYIHFSRQQKSRPGVVAHACNPRYLGGRDQSSMPAGAKRKEGLRKGGGGGRERGERRKKDHKHLPCLGHTQLYHVPVYK